MISSTRNSHLNLSPFFNQPDVPFLSIRLKISPVNLQIIRQHNDDRYFTQFTLASIKRINTTGYWSLNSQDSKPI